MRLILIDEPHSEIIAECANGQSAIEAIQRLKPDVVFLDIHMPGMDGFEVLEALEPAVTPWTIFLTAYDHHAVRAFEAGALDYLLKPASRQRITAALNRVRDRLATAGPVPAIRQWLAEREDHRRLAVRNGSSVVFVPMISIFWIEAADNYAIIHSDSQNLILRETLYELEERLPAQGFVRVSRSAIVNLKYIRQVRSDGSKRFTLILDGDIHIPITRNRHLIEDRLQS